MPAENKLKPSCRSECSGLPLSPPSTKVLESRRGITTERKEKTSRDQGCISEAAGWPNSIDTLAWAHCNHRSKDQRVHQFKAICGEAEHVSIDMAWQSKGTRKFSPRFRKHPHEEIEFSGRINPCRRYPCGVV